MNKLAQITSADWDAVCEFNRNLYNEYLSNSTEFSPATKKAYESNLRIWFVWIKNNLNNKKQTEIKPLEYKKYQNWLVNRGHSSADVNNKRSAISSLNNYIEIYYADEYPTFRNFINKSIKRPPKVAVNEKIPLSKSEYSKLVEVLEERKAFQKKAYLIYTLDTGCRREESRQLLKKVVNAAPVIKEKDGKKILFYQTHPIRCKGAGETGKTRRFIFSEATMTALKKWVEARGEDDCVYMFITKHGGKVRQINKTGFNHWASNDFTKILGRRFHPHLIRSSRATQMVVEEGRDIKTAQKLLGHENSSTTQLYVVRDDTDDLDDLYGE